jgi:hypothetical protein
MRRAFGNFRSPGPAIGFIADKEGLIVRSMSADAAIEFRAPGERPADTLWLPFEVLSDVEGKKDEPVALEATGDGQVSVQWRSGKVPQIVKYEAKEPFEADKHLALPTAFAANPPGLLTALHEASEIAAVEGVRFATGCVQLCPDGTINATDGRQLLVQTGFTFPWQDAVLVLRNKVFNSPELPHDAPVAVARSGNWAVVSVGPWTVYLRIDTDGRYPDVSRHVLDPASAAARCKFSEDDRRFLAETLPQLPSDEEGNYPVTIDLNGRVAIRAKAADQAKPTEVVLTNSQRSGDPIRINTNRTYLMRAMKLGMQDLCLYGAESQLEGFGDNRKYIWMPLDKASAIPPAEDAIRIESPAAPAQSPTSTPKSERKTSTVSEPANNQNGHAPNNGQNQANGHAKPNGKAASDGHAATNGHVKPEVTSRKPSSRRAVQQDLAALVEQAEKFRTAAQDLMHQANGLVKALKQHRRQNRAIETTLASIRQLKGLGV